jgi:hypothetical protein
LRAKYIYESIKDIFKSKTHKEIESVVCQQCPIFCEIFWKMFPDKDFNIDVNNDGGSYFNVWFTFREDKHAFLISQSVSANYPSISHLNTNLRNNAISGVFKDNEKVFGIDDVNSYVYRYK